MTEEHEEYLGDDITVMIFGKESVVEAFRQRFEAIIQKYVADVPEDDTLDIETIRKETVEALREMYSHGGGIMFEEDVVSPLDQIRVIVEVGETLDHETKVDVFLRRVSLN